MKDQRSYLKRLGKHIRETRKREGYTQDRIFDEAGFSRGTLSKIENRLVNPTVLTLKKDRRCNRRTCLATG